MKKLKVMSATLAAVSLIAMTGCSTISQDISLGSQLQALKSNPAAAQYSKVTARAEKAYYGGDNAMAAKLIGIVQEKVARGSTY